MPCSTSIQMKSGFVAAKTWTMVLAAQGGVGIMQEIQFTFVRKVLGIPWATPNSVFLGSS